MRCFRINTSPTAFILLLSIESSMKINLFAFVLSCLILGCHDPKVAVKSHQMGERADHSICWLTWDDSVLPVIENLPNASFWNDSIAGFEAHVKKINLASRSGMKSNQTFCCGAECKDDEWIAFPSNEGLVGSFSYRVLSNTSEVLSLMLRCNVHYSGGNLDWNEVLVINIVAQSGEAIPIPPELKGIEPSSLDSYVRNCIDSKMCSLAYPSYNHSEHFPDVVQDAIAQNRVGICDGEWVMCFDYNPFEWCAYLAQNVCTVTLDF